MIDKYKRGSVTISITFGIPSKDLPKGGTYDRLEKIALHKRETMNELVCRALDYYESEGKNGK